MKGRGGFWTWILPRTVGNDPPTIGLETEDIAYPVAWTSDRRYSTSLLPKYLYNLRNAPHNHSPEAQLFGDTVYLTPSTVEPSTCMAHGCWELSTW